MSQLWCSGVAGAGERRGALPGAAAGRRRHDRLPGVRVPHVLPRRAARAAPAVRAGGALAVAAPAAQVPRPAAAAPARLARAARAALRCAANFFSPYTYEYFTVLNVHSITVKRQALRCSGLMVLPSHK